MMVIHANNGPIRCTLGARTSSAGTPNLVIFAGKNTSIIFRTLEDDPDDELWDQIEESWVWEDLCGVSGEFKLSEDDENKILSEIIDLAERAHFRDLKYGHTSKTDVSNIAKHNDFLELRIPEPLETSGGRFRGRIYGYEPSVTLMDGTVFLLFHVKADGDKDLNARQNRYIDESVARAEVWERHWVV